MTDYIIIITLTKTRGNTSSKWKFWRWGFFGLNPWRIRRLKGRWKFVNEEPVVNLYNLD